MLNKKFKNSYELTIDYNQLQTGGPQPCPPYHPRPSAALQVAKHSHYMFLSMPSHFSSFAVVLSRPHRPPSSRSPLRRESEVSGLPFPSAGWEADMIDYQMFGLPSLQAPLNSGCLITLQSGGASPCPSGNPHPAYRSALPTNYRGPLHNVQPPPILACRLGALGN